jgi:hypothetical protein
MWYFNKSALIQTPTLYTYFREVITPSYITTSFNGSVKKKMKLPVGITE